ncbi:hypothetical protein PYW08_006602 [Mythimna loreyi]|uniref:Uncharacterized protein n=1 Tax=Mythimna loreyi TaxID=667449 RepID=A0ACC2QN09_9NEOP|nr:hypothetical protein PYW08_006602 [Mythimna loreyi]
MMAGVCRLLIGVSTAWQGEPRAWTPSMGPAPGLAGPRLAEFGASAVAARRRLHARLATRVRALPACRSSARWPFYANRSALVDCAFVDAASPQTSPVDVLAVGNCSAALLQRLERRAAASGAALSVARVDRAALLRALHNDTRSFLFLDYDMWQQADGVSFVESPPCVTVDYDCKQELDSSIAMRVADVKALQAYAPQLWQFVHDFQPSPESLRHILERHASGLDIEEAACEWALLNKSYVIPMSNKTIYIISTFICEDDRRLYDEIITKVGALIRASLQLEFDIDFRRYFIDCSDEYHMSERLYTLRGFTDSYNLIGVVSMAVRGAAAASATAAAARVPLVLADVVGDAGARGASTWRAGGRPRHLALALRRLVLQSGWARVAVLTDDSPLAREYYAAFHHEAMIIRQFQLKAGQPTRTVLQDLIDTKARIVFVNMDARAALSVLSVAAATGMRYSDGYVWILREWLNVTNVSNGTNVTDVLTGTKPLTVSFVSRELGGIPAAEGWKPLHARLAASAARAGTPRAWPPRAAAVADALISLFTSFRHVFQRHPSLRHDLRNTQMIQLLAESFIENPVVGFSQRVHYAERSMEEMFVYVDQWRNGTSSQRLATWLVNATADGAVSANCSGCAAYSRPPGLPAHDGASACRVRSGDRFAPTCHDDVCGCALLLLALAPGAALLVRRALRRRLARMRREQQIQLIARRRHVATVLAAYLVERGALELCEELGAGRFGSVCRARLREPGRAPRYIAAKALRDSAAPAEESEFLREACMIASLDHAHIVRLVGVCISDGPPLVLMELAFFGDLLGYLRERRHLVEDTGSEEPAACGEAEHVSAEALTRLAREAAEALQYLGVRGVVHRDVRAANCLVDVRRSLKLADFGMARDTVAGADGAPEYACRRRGLFPVLWMAPESLAHGVFSAASDVWALGVLVLELVTLGVRPYGSMSPLRVLEYVAAGGSPPLPLDATPQTRGLVRLCWARAAERRPGAAEVAAYLAAWPRALAPALLSERDEPADVDSGFGESPSTELLPPDSPLNSFDQLDDIAVTH